MKVVVNSLIKVGKSEFLKPGSVVDMDEKLAKPLLKDGIVVLVEDSSPKEKLKKKAE